MVTDIIFDWGGVLAPSTTRDIARKISKKCDYSEETVYKTIVEIESKYETIAEYEGFYEEISERLCPATEELKEMLNNVSVDQVFHLAQTLSKNYGIHLLSNQVAPKAQAIRKANDLSFFKNIFFSNEIGLRKPSEEIFKFIIKMLKKDPENFLFVDDRKENTDAAKRHGFQVLTFKNIDQLKEDLQKLGINW